MICINKNMLYPYIEIYHLMSLSINIFMMMSQYDEIFASLLEFFCKGSTFYGHNDS